VAGKTMHMQDSQGNNLLVAYRRVLDGAGMNWVAVVAVPRTAMLADVSNLVEMVTIAGVLALACALIMGMRVFGKVADEVHQLSEAVRSMGQGPSTPPSIRAVPMNWVIWHALSRACVRNCSPTASPACPTAAPCSMCWPR
jgi:hypothetical protein